MKTWILGLGSATVLGALFSLFAACSSSSDAPPGATPLEDAGDGAANPDTGGPLPEAQGDPCRGVPLPEDQHYVPDGLCARVVASGVSKLRSIAFSSDGDLFGQAQSGTIFRFHDEDGDGFFQKSEIKQYAASNGNGNNVSIDEKGGYLYAGAGGGVVRFTWAPGATSGGDPEDVVVKQPTGGHGVHTVHVYDGYLYVVSSSAGNATNETPGGVYDTVRSVVKRWPLASFTPGTPFEWSTGEVFTQGLRNMNGFTRNAAGRMYGVVNGLDNQRYKDVDVHNDNPGEQVLEVAAGKKYGYPFCFTAQRVVDNGTVIAPGTQLFNQGFGVHDDGWCATNSDKPTTFVQAHSAPLDITFFDSHPKGALPEKWRGGAFVALHGSWNRSPNTGYKVIWIPFDAAGNAPMPTSTETTTTFPYETVFGGGKSGEAKDGAWSWTADTYSEAPRPVGVAVSPVDGALYISSDLSGYVYRVGLKK